MTVEIRDAADQLATVLPYAATSLRLSAMTSGKRAMTLGDKSRLKPRRIGPTPVTMAVSGPASISGKTAWRPPAPGGRPRP